MRVNDRFVREKCRVEQQEDRIGNPVPSRLGTSHSAAMKYSSVSSTGSCRFRRYFQTDQMMPATPANSMTRRTASNADCTIFLASSFPMAAAYLEVRPANMLRNR